MKQIPLHFIHCSTRSGSTMLVQMLNQNENVISTSEEQFLIEFYHCYKNKKKWSRSDIEKFIKEFWHLSKKNPEFFFISKKELANKLNESSQNLPFWKLIQIIYSSYFPFMEKKQIEAIVDKQVWYVHQWDRINTITPESRHLILIRDFKDYLGSVKKRSMEDYGTIKSQAYVWALAYRRLYKIIQKNPKKTMVLHYEDLVKNPKTELKRVCYFFGINYSDNMLNFHVSHKKQIDNLPYDSKEFTFYKTILSGLNEPLNDKNVGIGHSVLTEREVYLSENICNSIAEKFDYKVTKNSNYLIKPFSLFYVYYQQVIKARLYFYFPVWLKIKLRKKQN